MKLYELPKAIHEALALVNEETGEMPPEAVALLESLETEFNQRVEGCCLALRNIEADEEALRTEAQNLQKAAQRRARTIEWLKRYVLDSMVAVGRKTAGGTLYSASLKATPAALRVVDPVALGAEASVIAGGRIIRQASDPREFVAEEGPWEIRVKLKSSVVADLPEEQRPQGVAFSRGQTVAIKAGRS